MNRDDPTASEDSESTRDPRVVEAIDELVRRVGGDPATLDGELAREMVQNSLRMLRDGSDTGELKLASRSARELRYALKVFRRHRHERKVSIFGSARTDPSHADYQTAVRFSRAMAEAGWMAITGAGGGIMRAGHEGAGTPRSFGAAIRLPFETTANEFIEDDPKLVTFRYFFTRKLIFVSQADALALLPGGFGTLDECFEVMTLLQTGKSPIIPIVMVEPPGSGYWQQFDQYIREHLLARELINPDDLHLYRIFEDPDEAARHTLGFYRNYHSQRFVRDTLVLRIRQKLTDEQLTQLNDEFADLVETGRIEQTDALDLEHEHLDLPRIALRFTRRDYGRLRLLIDRLNEFVEPQMNTDEHGSGG